MSVEVTLEEVRKVADLARLELSESEIEAYAKDLAKILEHVARLEELDVSETEPMSHPTDVANRLDDDAVRAGLPIDTIRANAPEMYDRYLVVPKTLTDAGSA